MSDKNNKSAVTASLEPVSVVVMNAASEVEAPNIDATDDFDPFSGVVECVEENLEIDLKAPPETQWYHGRLDRNVAEDRLRQASQLGSYLIRESDRKPGSYVLSFFGRTGVNHFRITAMCGDYYIGGREFDSLSDLIGYYTSYSDLLKGERLQFPVPPPEPVYDKKKVIAILTYNKMPDTDELSFIPGEIFVVCNDMGDGWLWVTSQSTGRSGIVNRELVKDLNGNVDPVEANEWFHGNITKEEAASRLAKAGPDSWLVRPSDTTDGDFSIFFFCNNAIQRFKIHRSGNQYFMGGRLFESIAEIVDRYKREQIVEGHVLVTPVLRPRPYAQTEIATASQIYQSMRQSNGSNFFLNRKDTIVIKGYLNKKSQRTKKWKSLYFVLNGTEQQLYYFDNQKRSKPKGLIDLSYSSLYPVHDSLFGRPNCFQIVLRALNQVAMYYICADNPDLALEWMQALKPYCQNTQPKRPTAKPEKLLPALTELRSLHIKVFNAKKLSCRHIPHPYCVMSLNEVKVCRTQVKEAPDSCWDEDFTLDDIPLDIDTVVMSLYNKEKMSKDKEVLNMKVSLSDLNPGQTKDDWYGLMPVNATAKADMGTMRISIRYLHEVIMPAKEYSSLKELLLAKDLETVLALSSVSAASNDRAPLATALLQIFRHERQEAHLLRTLNDLDIDHEDSAATLFRANTLATTLMDQYMKMTSTLFVHTAVQSVINKIMESKQSCEINPNLLDNASDVDINVRHLIFLLNEVVTSIIQAIDAYPVVLKYICNCLQRKVKQKWPNDPLVRTRVVSGFVFLRLLCPAILNPKQFNLITEIPTPMAARTMKLVANSLIKLANLVEAKEPHMEVINPFLLENKQRIVAFLDEISNVTDPPTPHDTSALIDISRSLATIHQICTTHLQELQTISNTKPFIKKLVTVTEMLTNHKQRYMSQS
jgi:Ras GTPase-activating protein 1